MATSNDGVFGSKKRAYDHDIVSSSTNFDSTRKKRNGRKDAKDHENVDGLGVGVGIVSQRDSEKSENSIGNAARDLGKELVPKKDVVPENGAALRSPSPVINFGDFSGFTAGTNERREENEKQAAARLEKMRGAVRTLLECIGEDPDREGLVNTPLRYAKALMFLTKGYQVKVEETINKALFHEGHNEMVIVKDIEIFSLCEHHLAPFTGKMHIGYIPSDTVIGLSKLPRIAEIFSRRLQIQERLTKEVANAIMKILTPKGVAVVMESSHLCMVIRGVEKTSAMTITSCMLGSFKRKSKTRDEFMSLIHMNH
ncbi:Fc.00g055530.m01.CDS01 [Cosmosporella sp. VM-42]